MASSSSSARSRLRPAGPVPLRLTAGVVAAAFAFPAMYLIWRNITTDAEPLELLFSDRTLRPMWRTIRLAVLVALSTSMLGTTLAWLTTRTDIAFASLWRVLVPLPLVYPTFIGAAALIRTLSPGGIASELLDTIGLDHTIELRGLFGAWLVLTLFTYPYVYLTVAARLRSLSGSLEESARSLGDSGWRSFRKIVLPQTASAISAGTLLVVLYTISDFGAVQLMRYDTLTRAIWTTRLNNQPVSFALSLILLLLAAAVVIVERLLNRRLTTPDRPQVRRPSRPISLGHWHTPALAFVILVIGLALAGPALALADWAIDGIVRDASGERSLFIEYRDLLEPTWNTAMISVITAVCAVVAVLPVAFLVGRYRSRVGPFANDVIMSTFALPGLLIALALFFWTLKNSWAREHLRETLFILVFAYVVRFGAQAMAAAHIAVMAVPRRIDDAAQMLGAGRTKRLFTVDMPLMLPGLIAGAGLVMLSTMKELPIALLVAPFDFPTLTTKTFLNFDDAFIAEAGLFAIVLVALSAMLTWLLVVRRADHLD